MDKTDTVVTGVFIFGFSFCAAIAAALLVYALVQF
jgi:hypothetical protein